MGKLDGKVTWITGAGSGIGEAVAERFGAEGATVVVTGRRKDRLEQVGENIRRQGGIAEVQPADLTISADVQRVVDWIGGTFGRLDVLVSNAGLNVTERSWANLTPDGVDQLIRGNLSSAFYVSLPVRMDFWIVLAVDTGTTKSPAPVEGTSEPEEPVAAP